MSAVRSRHRPPKTKTTAPETNSGAVVICGTGGTGTLSQQKPVSQYFSIEWKGAISKGRKQKERPLASSKGRKQKERPLASLLPCVHLRINGQLPTL
jgi:hypothetical protein